MPSGSPQRHEIVASLRDRHDEQLRRVVEHRATTDAAIANRACQNAWAQLVDAHDIDLRPPRWAALAWVTTCAMRQAHALAQQTDRAASTARLTPHRPER
jgi:hypothetical protein